MTSWTFSLHRDFSSHAKLASATKQTSYSVKMPYTAAGLLNSGGNNQLVGSGVAVAYQFAALNENVERVLSLLHDKEVEKQRALPPKPSVPQRCEWCHPEEIPSPAQLTYLHSDRYPVTTPKPRLPSWSWRWNPDKKMSSIPPPGERISILDVPDMARFCDPSHEL